MHPHFRLLHKALGHGALAHSVREGDVRAETPQRLGCLGRSDEQGTTLRTHSMLPERPVHQVQLPALQHWVLVQHVFTPAES